MFNFASQEVWKWFLYRKSITERAKPSESHVLLTEIEEMLKDKFALISQNVDGLHRKAGNAEERTFLLHGDFDFVRCGVECSKELYRFPKGINLDKEWYINKVTILYAGILFLNEAKNAGNAEH